MVSNDLDQIIKLMDFIKTPLLVYNKKNCIVFINDFFKNIFPFNLCITELHEITQLTHLPELYSFLIDNNIDTLKSSNFNLKKFKIAAYTICVAYNQTIDDGKHNNLYDFSKNKPFWQKQITQITGQADFSSDNPEEYLIACRKFYENLIRYMPGNVYWVDKDCNMLGCNQNTLNLVGLNTIEEFVGLSYEQINEIAGWTEGQASSFKQDDLSVIETGVARRNVEEPPLYDKNNEPIYYVSNRVPMFDKQGKVICVIGISTDITELKKTQAREEAALLENEAARLKASEQSKFLKIASQVAHDIRSPLSSLLMIVRSCDEIPEQYRIALREAAVSIGDIANNLLNTYQNPASLDNPDNQQKTNEVLVSALLLELLTEKKYQYHDLPVKFDYDFDAYFAFIHIRPSDFRRMLSNLINNAVDAFEKKHGKVLIKLRADNEWVKIIIEDNGKGMSPTVVNKILNQIAVTAGKKEGHGIGLTQVRETLTAYQGEMAIESVLKQGTSITITFPRMATPAWIADKIQLFANDIVVILDDDASIHAAWDTHFDHVLKQYSNIILKHFDRGDEALEYIKQLSEEQKVGVFLLTDFELLKQALTGLQVIEQTNIKRSILVTSHYNNPQVMQQAAITNTKILPKQLASEIPIAVDSNISQPLEVTIDVDFIVIDDDKAFTDVLAMSLFSDYNVDYYHLPEYFLKKANQYRKDIKIYIDGNFQGSSLNGLAVAEYLHEKGFTRLYLLSGEMQVHGPEYLTTILKDDLDALEKTLVEK